MYSIITVLVVIGCIVFFVLKIETPSAKKGEKPTAKKEENNIPDKIQDTPDNGGVPEALQELYNVALNPTKQGKPVLYALITCHHCARMQRYLKEENVDFAIVHVDLFDSEPREKIMTVLKQYNERGSFPTLIMPDGTTVAGFRIALLKEALGNDTTTTYGSI